MALVGIQALSYRDSSCSIFMFFKRNLQNFSVTWNKDRQQLRPSHIISVNYLDLDQACATHEFQVQSKSLYQNNFIQNSGEFKAKSWVLERNYNRATIHHFHSRDYSESSLFYSALKNKLSQTLFYFVSIFRSHIITITIYIYYEDNFLFCFHSSFFNYLKETKN